MKLVRHLFPEISEQNLEMQSGMRELTDDVLRKIIPSKPYLENATMREVSKEMRRMVIAVDMARERYLQPAIAIVRSFIGGRNLRRIMSAEWDLKSIFPLGPYRSIGTRQLSAPKYEPSTQYLTTDYLEADGRNMWRPDTYPLPAELLRTPIQKANWENTWPTLRAFGPFMSERSRSWPVLNA